MHVVENTHSGVTTILFKPNNVQSLNLDLPKTQNNRTRRMKLLNLFLTRFSAVFEGIPYFLNVLNKSFVVGFDRWSIRGMGLLRGKRMGNSGVRER